MKFTSACGSYFRGRKYIISSCALGRYRGLYSILFGARVDAGSFSIRLRMRLTLAIPNFIEVNRFIIPEFIGDRIWPYQMGFPIRSETKIPHATCNSQPANQFLSYLTAFAACTERQNRNENMEFTPLIPVQDGHRKHKADAKACKFFRNTKISAAER